jgi:hypothetical protein
MGGDIMELTEVQKKIFELTIDGFKKNKEQILKLEQLEEELLRKEIKDGRK